MIEIGLKHTSETTVCEKNSAITIGSGDMPVLATPAMIALMENAAMLAVKEHLPSGSTTVGNIIKASHDRPSPIGARVHAIATLTAIDGRRLEFEVEAFQGDSSIGKGTHTRIIVDRDRFLSKLK